MNLKVLILDLDSTLTDGIYQVSHTGEIAKNFYTRDFAALERLAKKDVDIYILTGSSDRCIDYKISGFYLDFLEKISISKNVEDKFAIVSRIIKDCNMKKNEIAYMGDSITDLKCIEDIYLSGCPADAEKIILKSALFVSDKNGGHGAVEDFVEFLIGREECQN